MRTLNGAMVSETEAADYLGLAVATLRRWRWSGDGPAYCKLGRAVRYRVSDLEGYLEAAR